MTVIFFTSFAKDGVPKLCQEEAPAKPQKWLHGLDLDPKVQNCCDNMPWPLLANARPCLQMQMLLLQTHGHRKRCPNQQLGQPGSVRSSYIGPSVGQTTGSWGCTKNILRAGNHGVLWSTGLALLHACCMLFFLGLSLRIQISHPNDQIFLEWTRSLTGG